MLINDYRALSNDPLLMMIGGSRMSGKLADGIYQISHFGCTGYPSSDYDQYPEIGAIHCYGVCDHYQQILDKCPLLISSNRKFLITVTKIEKSNEPIEGGWRWHKWGEYIGEQKPQCEYLVDEPLIKEVFVYHIYERVT